ncbi:hypothetical protein NBRC116493_29030 [Aurantivibrio infirmus]
MSKISLKEITEFTISEVWKPEGDLNENTCLLCGFKLAGEDGKDFIESFAKKFNMDISNFDWVEIFGPEAGGNPIAMMIYLFQRLMLGRSNRELCSAPHVSLSHLQSCANTGKWVNP